MYYQKKSSNSPIIIFIFFIIIMVGAVILIKFKNSPQSDPTKKKEEPIKISREVEYTDEKYIYNIIQDNDKFEIIIKIPDECESKPCGGTKVDSYKITKQNEIDDLKELFDKLFSKESKHKLELDRNDISIDDYAILESVFREPDKEIAVTYKILDSTPNSGIINAGYKITKKEEGYLLTIALGEKNTDGYSIEITKIVVNQDILDIHVKEVTAKDFKEVKTTPAINIELNYIPDIIKITGDKNYQFDEISNNQPTKPQEESTPKETDNYKILESTNNASYKLRGYYLDNNVVTIASGRKNTGGYTIEITKVIYENNEATITIKENTPPKDSTTIQAITYPIVRIEFKEKPTKITILDENNNQLQKIE